MFSLDNFLKILGIAWSVIAFIAAVSFFFGGQWNDWKEIREAHQQKNVINNVSNSGILPLDSPGQDVELDLADKTYYPGDCTAGEVRAVSMINDGNAQAAICACILKNHGANGVVTGKGWYCLN